MSEKKSRSWPMTREQSFIAAAVFVSFFVLWFLWAAVGQSALCWIESHPGTASWVQAIGGLLAIIFAGRFVGRQIKHAEFQQRRLQLESDEASVWACLYAANDAHHALKDLARKLSGDSKRPPSSSTERIEGLEETIRVLLASKPCASAVSSLLVIMAELAYSRVAIREFTAGGDRTAQASKSLARAQKVDEAVRNLGRLHKHLQDSLEHMRR